MKKIYLAPANRWAEMEEASIIATSGNEGVGTGKSLGNEYTSTDVSYSRDNSNLWDEEW